MIIVTGGAGFIGSNLIKALNRQDRSDIIVVDNLSKGEKFVNLVNLQIADYLDKDAFLDLIINNELLAAEVIFHQGACSVTTEWDGRYMMQNNYEYSKTLLHYCLTRDIPFIYASSAAVYGGNQTFQEQQWQQAPLNVYGYSKYLFDQYVRAQLPDATSQVVGWRYFNVYGPREQAKQNMASVVFHLRQQLFETGKIRLFDAYDGYAAGEQKRDFIYVDDVAAVNLWAWAQPQLSGIFNVGTGQSRSFNDLAQAVLNYYGEGELEYIPFPKHLKGRYQSFTEADISQLRQAGYNASFTSLETGVNNYLAWLDSR